MKITILIDDDEVNAVLTKIIRKALNEVDQDAKKTTKLYSINQVARKLNRAHATIKKLVTNNLIQITKDGLISEESIENYLKNN
ncbi:MAG: hypothetical protein AB9842_08080 [Bacteroidales bacterium]